MSLEERPDVGSRKGPSPRQPPALAPDKTPFSTNMPSAGRDWDQRGRETPLASSRADPSDRIPSHPPPSSDVRDVDDALPTAGRKPRVAVFSRGDVAGAREALDPLPLVTQAAPPQVAYQVAYIVVALVVPRVRPARDPRVEAVVDEEVGGGEVTRQVRRVVGRLLEGLVQLAPVLQQGDLVGQGVARRVLLGVNNFTTTTSLWSASRLPISAALRALSGGKPKPARNWSVGMVPTISAGRSEN